MTYDDDFARIHFETGPRNLQLKSLNLDWPPPVVIDIFGFKYRRSSISEITDEVRSRLDYVCRGAEYFPLCEAVLNS